MSTPIAVELRAHFDRGGGIEEAIRLVEALERASARLTAPTTRANGLDRRGCRLPADWRPSPAEVQFALGKGMSERRVFVEAEKFLNYWTAKSGAGATKRDWSATWRNWIITSMERGNGPASYRGSSPGTDFTSRRVSTGSDAILAGMGRLANRVDQRRTSAVTERREVRDDPNPSFAFDA
jgi:hypothetical protein